MRVQITDIKDLPNIGEICMVPDESTWEPQKLSVVDMIEDNDLARLMERVKVVHVFFASPDEDENINTSPSGKKYLTIRTYG